LKPFNDPAYKKFVRKLRDARKAAHLSQDDLAKRLDRHQTYVSKIETLERTLDLRDYLIWAIEIDIEPLAFLESFADDVRNKRPRRTKGKTHDTD
jgi:transcriptional regulator with XRE-family HTH domain